MLSLSRLATLSLSILLVTTGTLAHAGAPVPSDAKPAKSISLKAAQKMYRGFAKSTAASMERASFKMTESRNEDGLLELHSVTLDRRGNGRLVEYGATTILLVSNKLYLSPREVNESYGEFELEIARDLGYRIDENWSTVSGLDPKAVRSDFRSTAAPDTALLNWFKADLAKASWRPASKDGKSGTLIVEQARQELLASEVGLDFSLPARSILITVKSGKVTGIIEKDESSTVTTRYESYTKLLSKPSGPIVDFDKILLDDRYAAGWAKEQAINLLRRAGREAAALAAFDGNEAISDENWDEALQGDDAVRRTVTGFEVRVIYPGYPVSKADQEFLFCDSDPSGWARYSDSRPSADQLLEGPCPVLRQGSGGPGGLFPVGKATQE